MIRVNIVDTRNYRIPQHKHSHTQAEVLRPAGRLARRHQGSQQDIRRAKNDAQERLPISRHATEVRGAHRGILRADVDTDDADVLAVSTEAIE